MLKTETLNMQQRLDVLKIAPEAFRVMSGLQSYVTKSGLESTLVELVKIRASQINGCAYCIDMHTKDARLNGESEQRIYALSAWRETPFFTDREKAALTWTETLTLISENHAPDHIYEEVHRQFTDKEMVALTMAVVAINSWNRLVLSFRPVPGTYQPQAAHQELATSHA
jgi:AhpD family alkylhydroperoxidase